MKHKGLIFIISGPSGSGKTTLLKNLLKRRDLRLRFVRAISFTTRPKRSGEREGKDYFFISVRQFEQKKKSKKFLEWTRYLDYYYATSKGFIERQLKKGKNIILCLDLRGSLKIKRLYPKNTVTIFIKPPSLELLHHRIEKRCNRTQKEEIQRRIKLARRELLASRIYDYCLVNKDLAQVTRKLKEIILKEIDSKCK